MWIFLNVLSTIIFIPSIIGLGIQDGERFGPARPLGPT
jgi:hypothetical protein